MEIESLFALPFAKPWREGDELGHEMATKTHTSFPLAEPLWMHLRGVRNSTRFWVFVFCLLGALLAGVCPF